MTTPSQDMGLTDLGSRKQKQPKAKKTSQDGGSKKSSTYIKQESVEDSGDVEEVLL